MRGIRHRRSSGARRPAFTLVEVMVALGIMAAALPMVATALMSGMLENEESVRTTMGCMLADNAVAILRCRAKDSDFPADWGAGANVLTKANRVSTSIIADADCDYWPFEDPAHPEGRRTFAFVILGQRMESGSNDFRFVVLVYRKVQQADTLHEAQATFSSGVVSSDPADTYVQLTSAPTQSALLSAHAVRMSLRP